MLKHNTESLTRYRDNCVILLAWIEENQAKLEGLTWSPCHIFMTVDITPQPDGPPARTIARRWPGRVWVRTKNVTACGILDWCSKPDGEIPIKIVGAETIKWIPQPDSEVTP